MAQVAIDLTEDKPKKKRAARVNRIIEQLPEFPVKDIVLGERAREDLKDVEALASTILEHGILQPIVIDQDNNLVAGGRRYAAIKLLKWQKVPIVRVQVDAKSVALELELLENIGREDMHWYEQAKLYHKIFEAKKVEDPKWSQTKQALFLGRSQSDVQRYLEAYTYVDAVPELKQCASVRQAQSAAMKMAQQALVNKTVAKVKKQKAAADAAASEDTEDGPEAEDEYEDGDTAPPVDVSTLFPAGSTEESDKAAKAAAKKAARARAVRQKANPLLFDLEESYIIGNAIRAMYERTDLHGIFHFAEVDTPYGIDLKEKRSKSKNAENDAYNEVPGDHFASFIKQAADGVFKLMAGDAYVVWWFAEDWQPLVRGCLEQAGFSVSAIPAVWYKGPVGQTNNPTTTLGNSYESFFVCRKGNPPLFKPGRSNVFHYAGVHGNSRWHPTQRPAELIDELIATFAPKNCHILSPFLGSGQTIISALKAGNSAVGWDLNPRYRNRYLYEGLEQLAAMYATTEEAQEKLKEAAPTDHLDPLHEPPPEKQE